MSVKHGDQGYFHVVKERRRNRGPGAEARPFMSMRNARAKLQRGFERRDQEKSMAKDKDEAKAEGFKRGLAGKTGNAGMTQGWSDDKAAGTARTQGYMEGKRKRQRNEAEKTARGKK